MGQRFEDDALTSLYTAYGLTTLGSSSATELDDGNVQQVIPLGEIARRSLAPSGPAGLFHARYKNIHAGVGELQSFINPYVPANASNGFLTARPGLYDIWVTGVACWANGNFAQLTWAAMTFTVQAVHQMMSANDSVTGGGITPVTTELPLVGWDEFSLFKMANNPGVGTTGNKNKLMQELRFRVPRGGGTLNFRTEATGAVTVDAIVTMAMFPAGLGQDAFA